MDPVTAFGLAGTAATFVDFGIKLVKLTWTIYHAENEDTTMAGELAQTAISFEEAARSVPRPQTTEHRLGQLITESVEFSNKLVQRLQKEGLLGTAQPRSARKALGTAFRHIFRSKELSELKDKIVELERQLSLQMLISLRQFATQTLKNQETILSNLQVSSRIDDNTTSGTQAILQHVTAQDHLSSREPLQRGLEFNLIEQIYQNSNTETASRIVLTADEHVRTSQTILSALSYKGIGDRQHRVAHTFETTFSWILEEGPADQKWHSLQKWLVEPESIYWISGKPGSGKSTLMKYLSSPIHVNEREISRCQAFLEQWAGERTLIVASFYFWAADPGQMQKSRAGLLRTLLHHVLTARSDLIPTVLPSRWEALALVGVHQQLGEWNISELQDCLFQALKALETSASCICFFIDGLDEFDDDLQLLIDFVRDLSSLGTHIKLCVASRPWIEFQDAFQAKPHLSLQDLTRKDIELFVSQKFSQNPEFAELQIREPAYSEELVSNVVTKSAGVFLWVALVVSSLLAGITNSDRVEDLQRRLELLPPDLKSLYERILAGLDEFYHQHRAHMIMLMESAEDSLPLLVFALADESNFSSLIGLLGKPTLPEILDVRMNAARRRLNTRWKGLIEVDMKENLVVLNRETILPKVWYLHRSVQDFIQGSVMQGYLTKYASPSYDPQFQLCLAYCGCVKANLYEESDRLQYAVSALRYAIKVSASKQGDLLRTMDELAHAVDCNTSSSTNGYYKLTSTITEVGIVAHIIPENFSRIPRRYQAVGTMYSQSIPFTTRSSSMSKSLSEAMKLGFLVFPMEEVHIRELRTKAMEYFAHPPHRRIDNLDPVTEFVRAKANLVPAKDSGSIFSRMKRAIKKKAV